MDDLSYGYSSSSDIIKPDMTFEIAWRLIRDKETENKKDNKLERQFYDNWLQPIY